MASVQQKLAATFIDHSLKVQPGDKLLIACSDFTPLELLRECYRLAIERGAIVELDIFGMRRNDTGSFVKDFLSLASDTQLTTLSEITVFKADWADKLLFITALHDDAYLADIDPKRMSLWNKTLQPLMEKTMGKTWVLTHYPTQNLAERAGMSLDEFTNFFYDACLIDYAAESARLEALQTILDEGKEVHIVSPGGTDLRLGIEGRLAAGANVGNRNIPDGECFLAPLEDRTEGTITFELPQRRSGIVVEEIELEFRGGKIEKAKAGRNDHYFQEVLDEHPDNRRLGELGIGMNRQITRYIQNILFDEKIAGTIHMALGRAYTEERGGGKNQGTIHWDLVKDLRVPGSRVTVDDRVIIRDGEVVV